MKNIAILLACITLGSLAIIAYAIYLLAQNNKTNQIEGRTTPVFYAQAKQEPPEAPQPPTIDKQPEVKLEPEMDQMSDVEKRFEKLADKEE